MRLSLLFQVPGLIVLVVLALVNCGRDDTPIESKGPEPGVEWTEQNSGIEMGLLAVAWSGTHFVAVGDSGTIIRSPDGIDWTDRESGTKRALFDVAWVGDEFIVVGDSGTILSSASGVSWTSVPSPVKDDLFGIASSDSVRVIVGDSGTVLSSPLDTDWQIQPSPHRSLHMDVVWNGQEFLAVGPLAVIASADGKLWRLVTSEWLYLLSVCWTGREYFAVGLNGLFVSSPDSETWQMRDPFYIGGIPYSIVSSGTLSVIVGAYGKPITSIDGEDWIAREVEDPVQLMDIVWSGEKFVAVGVHGRILTSP